MEVMGDCSVKSEAEAEVKSLGNESAESNIRRKTSGVDELTIEVEGVGTVDGDVEGSSIGVGEFLSQGGNVITSGSTGRKRTNSTGSPAGGIKAALSPVVVGLGSIGVLDLSNRNIDGN